MLLYIACVSTICASVRFNAIAFLISPYKDLLSKKEADTGFALCAAIEADELSYIPSCAVEPQCRKTHTASLLYAVPQQGGASPKDLSEQVDQLEERRAAIARSRNKKAHRTLEGRGEGMDWEQE